MSKLFEKLIFAYFDCRKNKRWTFGAVEFEVDYEKNLILLCNELKNRTWTLGTSTCFIVEQPVKREIFAAPFRDRIVHHLLINELEPYFEKYFIRDSFACRKGKGTFAAVKRLEHFINSTSLNQKKEAYILKLDIKGFFMSINRQFLWEKLEKFIDGISDFSDEKKDFLKYLAKEISLTDSTQKVSFNSPESAWNGLPRDKSLFTCKKGCGLPIGNLTSQIFANFFLTEFDHYIKHDLKVRCYVRYVDDFVIVHNSRSYLKYLIPKIRNFLKEELDLNLHPRKIYLQPAWKGVQFLGAFLRPNYVVPGRRIRKNFEKKLKKYKTRAEFTRPDKEDKKQILSSVNSYLGIMRNYKSYRYRIKMLTKYFKDRLKNHFKLKKEGLKLEKK